MKRASYVVLHETRYRYEAPVGLSRQILHLTPRELPWQSVPAHAIAVAPEPESGLASTADAFGNPTRSFCIEADHDTLTVRA